MCTHLSVQAWRARGVVSLHACLSVSLGIYSVISPSYTICLFDEVNAFWHQFRDGKFCLRGEKSPAVTSSCCLLQKCALSLLS